MKGVGTYSLSHLGQLNDNLLGKRKREEGFPSSDSYRHPPVKKFRNFAGKAVHIRSYSSIDGPQPYSVTDDERVVALIEELKSDAMKVSQGSSAETLRLLAASTLQSIPGLGHPTIDGGSKQLVTYLLVERLFTAYIQRMDPKLKQRYNQLLSDVTRMIRESCIYQVEAPIGDHAKNGQSSLQESSSRYLRYKAAELRDKILSLSDGDKILIGSSAPGHGMLIELRRSGDSYEIELFDTSGYDHYKGEVARRKESRAIHNLKLTGISAEELLDLDNMELLLYFSSGEKNSFEEHVTRFGLRLMSSFPSAQKKEGSRIFVQSGAVCGYKRYFSWIRRQLPPELAAHFSLYLARVMENRLEVDREGILRALKNRSIKWTPDQRENSQALRTRKKRFRGKKAVNKLVRLSNMQIDRRHKKLCRLLAGKELPAGEDADVMNFLWRDTQRLWDNSFV